MANPEHLEILQRRISQWMKERQRKVLAVIPLNLDAYLPSGQAKPVLARLAADFTAWEQDARKFDAQVENVIRALRADDGGRKKPSEGRLQGVRVKRHRCRRRKPPVKLEGTSIADDQHYAVNELAMRWYLSLNTVRRLVADEPAVIKLTVGLLLRNRRKRHLVSVCIPERCR